MIALPREARLHLDAAEGWLGLGNWREAELEIAQISPDLETHPLVLAVRYRICGAAKRWDEAAGVARAFSRQQPEQPWGHFHLAYALHELKRTQEAYQTLRLVLDGFPDNWLMRFNLACYACQSGNLEEAMEWLGRAMALAGPKAVCALALEDKDLEPLWKRIREL